MRIVADSPTDTLLHVWRKRAKYLRHQIEALNVIEPAMLLPLEVDLERLTDLLGDDHDLAVLLHRIDADQGLSRDLELGSVIEAIAASRHELQRESLELGRALFEDPAAEFVARLEAVWGDAATF